MTANSAIKFRRHGKIVVLLHMLIVLHTLSGHELNAENELEFKIKAAYLYNFTRFVQWPDNTFATNDDPFNLCVLGKSPFLNALVSIEKRTVNLHPIVVRYTKNSSAIQDCQLLYIASSETKRLGKILSNLHGKPILTVASMPKFINRGGMLGFTLVKGKVRLEANLNNVRDTGLIIGAKLLEVSWQIVGNERRSKWQ